jgi:hypothetical protein
MRGRRASATSLQRGKLDEGGGISVPDREGSIRAIHGVVRWRACDLVMRLYEEFGLSVSDDTIWASRM